MNRTNLLIDTHGFIWFVNGDSQLASKQIKLITQAVENNSLYLSSISLWEISMLVAKNRISFTTSCLHWLTKAVSLTNTSVLPISPEIAVESCHLPGQFHDDPADRIIVATARIEELTLLTRDEKILNYGKNQYIQIIKI